MTIPPTTNKQSKVSPNTSQNEQKTERIQEEVDEYHKPLVGFTLLFHLV